MKHNLHPAKSIICAALLLALIPGCASKKNSVTPPVTGSIVNSGESDNSTETSNPRDIYKPSAEESQKLAEENSEQPMVFAGFDSHFFSTPALKSDLPSMTATPVFSHEGIHKYMTENSESFNFNEGDNSFAAFIEKYDQNYFADKGLLIVAFIDKEGGKDYSIPGAYENHLSGEGYEMDQLVFSIKKSDGENTANHFVVEIDKTFLDVWDTYSISFYK